MRRSTCFAALCLANLAWPLSCKSTDPAAARVRADEAVTQRAPALRLWLGFRRQELPGDDAPGAAAAFVSAARQHVSTLPARRAAYPSLASYHFALAPTAATAPVAPQISGTPDLPDTPRLPESLVLEEIRGDYARDDDAAGNALTVAHWQLFAAGKARVVTPQVLVSSGESWSKGVTTLSVDTQIDAAVAAEALVAQGARDLAVHEARGYRVVAARWEHAPQLTTPAYQTVGEAP